MRISEVEHTYYVNCSTDCFQISMERLRLTNFTAELPINQSRQRTNNVTVAVIMQKTFSPIVEPHVISQQYKTLSAAHESFYSKSSVTIKKKLRSSREVPNIFVRF